MTNDTLKITVGQADDHREAARQRLEHAVAGERGEAIEQDAQYLLNFEDYADVDRLMRTANLTLLEAIVAEQPDSIRETADAVDRDYKDVHRNLMELESLGVVEFTDGTNGGKKPVLRGGAETIDFAFSIDFSSSSDRSSATV